MIAGKDKYPVITGFGSLSALGAGKDEVRENYREALLNASYITVAEIAYSCCRLADSAEAELEQLLSIRDYRRLDRSVLMAVAAARKAFVDAGWDSGRTGVAVSLGSSRGATGLFEAYHENFLKSGRVSPYASPTTTCGNLSSRVVQDLNLDGPAFEHSMTCSTALYAIANCCAWLKSGMAEVALAGGAEAALTPFTVSQMEALGIYSKIEDEWPCRPFGSLCINQNTFILGEGAAVFALELMTADEVADQLGRVYAVIEGFGGSSEKISGHTDISSAGNTLQNSMKKALQSMQTINMPDAVIAHAPGTINGDSAELAAVRNVFNGNIPLLLSNKWLIGHAFGASAALSLEYALYLLSGDKYADFPYDLPFKNINRNIHKLMVNATGFGGISASLVVSQPEFFLENIK
ncbi:MAG: hypothetical protein D6719_06320, partial [Candidatus Dadabacteria bacterium]